jgi:hypothetical protein
VAQQSLRTDLTMEDSRTLRLANREKRKLDEAVEETSELSNNTKLRKVIKEPKEIENLNNLDVDEETKKPDRICYKGKTAE